MRSGACAASLAVTMDEHEHAKIAAGPPPVAPMTASSTRVSRSTDAGSPRSRSESPAPSRS